ncbi:hypothetical protein DMC30DRAFT_399167 [Rhodotorula diobovata]|uniref:Uncharacterized protein n=1 Tax=Rhodotorula diobovata TaxID=5288 RepID=A0A5C5FTG2_9BASI|nr:hypothetical protein DMC30DRAFT_399167 [Rhodotorula diobovata]
MSAPPAKDVAKTDSAAATAEAPLNALFFTAEGDLTDKFYSTLRAVFLKFAKLPADPTDGEAAPEAEEDDEAKAKRAAMGREEMNAFSKATNGEGACSSSCATRRSHRRRHGRRADLRAAQKSPTSSGTRSSCTSTSTTTRSSPSRASSGSTRCRPRTTSPRHSRTWASGVTTRRRSSLCGTTTRRRRLRTRPRQNEGLSTGW